MKTYTIRFVQQQPGGTKRVPVVTAGIEIGYGRIINCDVVSLGDPAGKLWEVPLMKGNSPAVKMRGQGEEVVFDCHPVPHWDKPGRFLLAYPERESQRVLLRIATEAGEQSGPSGAVVIQKGNAVRVGYGHTVNRQNAESVDILLDVYPGAVFAVTAGGTGSALHQRYLVEYNGEIKVSPLVEMLTKIVVSQPAPMEAAAEQRPVAQPTGGTSNYRRPAPPAQFPADLEAALEVASKMSPEDLAQTAGGRMKGQSIRRPGKLIMV